MSIASGITALVTALQTALNNRASVGASDYQMWLAQGNTGDMTAYRTSILGGDVDYATQFNNQLGTQPTAGTATETQTGVTQLASLAEAQAAGIATKALSPLNSLLMHGVLRGTDAQRQALTGTQLFDGLQFHATDTHITWKYLTGPGWRPWDSWWFSYTPSMVNFSSPSPTAVWRYNDGLVMVRLAVSCTSVGSGNITFSIPVSNSGTSGMLPQGSSIWVHAGVRYSFSMDFADANTLMFRYTSSLTGAQSQVSTTAPITWVSGDLALANFEYEPA